GGRGEMKSNAGIRGCGMLRSLINENANSFRRLIDQEQPYVE
ncbi:5697_t:CDS:1, partial [Funneliformis geosporum]